MFETDKNAEIHIPLGLRDENEKSWWYVKNRLHVAWFHLVCEFTYEDNQTLTQMLFLSKIDHLIELNRSTHIKIKQIDLMTPGHMNGSKRWKLEALSEIWTGNEPDIPHIQKAYIFVLANGNHYIDSALQTDENDLQDRTKVFNFA